MRHGRRWVQNEFVGTDLSGILSPALGAGDLSLLGSISRPSLPLRFSFGSLFWVLKVNDAWTVHLRVLIAHAAWTPANCALPTIVGLSSICTILPYRAEDG